MPAVLIKLYDSYDNDIYFWLTYGNEKGKRRKIQPVKLPWWKKMLSRINISA